MNAPSQGRAWLVTLAALGVFFIGRWLVIPGLDEELLRALAEDLGGGSWRRFTTELGTGSLFGVAVVPLLMVHVVLTFVPSDDAEKNARREQLGAMAYVVLCVLLGMRFAIHFESFGADPSLLSGGGPPLVMEPGMKFRLVAVATWTGGGAVLWALARWVTRRGVMHGAVLFAGVATLIDDGALVADGLRALGMQVVLVSPLAHALPWAIVLLAIGLFGPKSWPIELPYQLRLRSWAEVLFLPAALGMFVYAGLTSVGETAFMELPSAWTGVRAGALLVELIVAVLLAVVLLRPRMEKRRRWVAIVLGVLVPVAASAFVVVPMMGRMQERMRPGPFAGAERVDVVLRCEGADASVVEHDRRVLGERLGKLRVHIPELRADGDRLKLRLQDVSRPGELLAQVLPAWRLSFQKVADDSSPLFQDGVDATRFEITRRTDVGAEALPAAKDAETLRRYLANLTLPEGYQAAIECPARQDPLGAEETGCFARLLERDGGLSGKHISSAQTVVNGYDGRPQVSLTFDSEGARLFEDLTRKNVGKLLAIVLDGKIMSAPLIQEPISGGHAMISVGNPRGDPMTEARNIELGLATGALECEWKTESIAAAK